MTKQEWKKNTGALRRLIKNPDSEPVGGKFLRYHNGSTMCIMHRNLGNVIASIDIEADTAYIRYRPNSYYWQTILEAVKGLEVTKLYALPLTGRVRIPGEIRAAAGGISEPTIYAAPSLDWSQMPQITFTRGA